MKRDKILARMNEILTEVAEVGQAVAAALDAAEPQAEDLAALMTAADQLKTRADDFKADVAGAKGKEQRLAADFETGLRKVAAAGRLFADGLGGRSTALVATGKSWYNEGVTLMSESAEKSG